MTPRNIPYNNTVEFGFRHLSISVIVQSRLNVERGEYTSDDEVQCPESEVSSRTHPKNCSHNALFTIHQGGLRYLLPPPRSEHPILGIEDQGVDFSILEKPVWVECFWVGIEVWVTENRPDVLNHSGPRRDEVSPVYVVLGGFSWDARGNGWIPPKEFLDQSVDIRQPVPVRKVRKMFFANNSIEFLLCFPHDIGVENHRQEESLQGRPRLKPVSEK